MTASALLCCACVLQARTPVEPSGHAAEATKVIVPNPETSCNTDALQAVAAKLAMGVKVEKVVDGPNLPGGAKFTPASRTLPAYCQVSGSFVTNPKTGKTSNFLATLPMAWNSKYIQFGCAGHCGSLGPGDATLPEITITLQGFPGESIVKGYASFATDEGHSTATRRNWAVKRPGRIDKDMLDDFYYRSDEVLAKDGKAFTIAFYTQATGKPQRIAYSYFSGCSGGGRDALVAASFFPEEFDGIIVGSAYVDMVHVSFQAAAGALAQIRSKDAFVSDALWAKVDPIVNAKCDAADGVKDGLIQNPAACDFLPQRDLPQCDGKNRADSCFTKAQIETISVNISAVTDEHGKVVQPGYTVSDLQDVLTMPPPADRTALDPWPVDDLPHSSMYGLAAAVQNDFVHHDEPDFHLRNLITFGSGGPGLVTNYHAIVQEAEVATAEASAYKGDGNHPELMGKLIRKNRRMLIWANLSDEKLTPYMSINYYKILAKLYGGYAKLQNNIRLFLLPDTYHCSRAGCGPGSFDVLTAMENWVEKGESPDSLIATKYATKGNQRFVSHTGQAPFDYSRPVRTMPLCKFPEMVHYSGQGDVNDAANWSCPPNDKSMLKVGESGRQAGVIE